MKNAEKQIWYVSGPMTALPELNKPAFAAEAARMRALGFEVINPAENDLGPGAKWEAYMRVDLAQLLTCNSVILLPGWERSDGAQLELHVARALGMTIALAAGKSPFSTAAAAPDWAAA